MSIDHSLWLFLYKLTRPKWGFVTSIEMNCFSTYNSAIASNNSITCVTLTAPGECTVHVNLPCLDDSNWQIFSMFRNNFCRIVPTLNDCSACVLFRHHHFRMHVLTLQTVVSVLSVYYLDSITSECMF